MSNGKKGTFWSELLEAMVIRPRTFEDKPKVYQDTFGGDLANALLLRPPYRKPAPKAPQDETP